MRIVILLGGLGSRFATVGYTKPKPLIRVGGKTMLEHVISMYPGDHEFILICNEVLANAPEVQAVVRDLPRARIVTLPSRTTGPVQSLSAVWDTLPQDEPVLVSYCDFNVAWDFSDFERAVASGAWDGAVPSYTGFHPHLLHAKKYAGILADESGAMLQIQEKHCFTENPEDSFHSAGNYYFRSAGEMKHYGEELIRSGETVNDEQYVSMIYYAYLKDTKNILVYPLKKFMQWGTPEDLEEYEAWRRMLSGSGADTTDIPESREHYVRIPYQKGTPEHQNSVAYWKEYFQHNSV